MVSEMTIDRKNAIQKIMDGVYMHNRENANVVSSICTLFVELSHYGTSNLFNSQFLSYLGSWSLTCSVE